MLNVRKRKNKKDQKISEKIGKIIKCLRAENILQQKNAIPWGWARNISAAGAEKSF